MRPRWSIVVTTYKRLDRLRDLLCRLADAVPDGAEILIADDDPESTEWEGEPPRLAMRDVTVRHLKTDRNRGAAGNVNRAISQSSGSMLHWCADDDWPDPWFYESMDVPGADLIHCGYRNHLPDGRIWDGPMLRAGSGPIRDKSHLARMLFGNPTHMVSTVFLRSLWDQLGGFDERFPLFHDWHFLIRANLRTDPYFVAERLANYRQHSASLTGRATDDARSAELAEMQSDVRWALS